DNARLQESEVVPTSAVQGEVANGSFIHQRTHGRSGRFHQRRFFGDGDLVGNLSDLESEIHYSRAADGERNSTSNFGLKTRELGFHFIIAQRQFGNSVTAALVGRGHSGDSRLHVLGGDRHSGNDGSRRILHDSGNGRRRHLGRSRMAAQENHTDDQQYRQISRHVFPPFSSSQFVFLRRRDGLNATTLRTSCGLVFIFIAHLLR